jgi:hypothetical protein
MKGAVSAIVIGLSVMVTAIILSNGFRNRNKALNEITVTGLGSKDFSSDLIVWDGSFARKSMDLQEAYSMLRADQDKIREYLLSKGVSADQLVFTAVQIDKEYEYSYDQHGNSLTTFDGYRLTQRVNIESGDVSKIEALSREITELIDLGVEFSSEPPRYYYTRLAELKVEMIAAATQDARIRAEKIAENSGAKLGKLKMADMGVFQIIARNSSEDYSWGGSFNTSSKEKTATITMRLSFAIR